MPLNFFPAFIAICDHGTVRAAGEALSLTHSAVSQQVKELEHRLGFKVFDRRGRRLVLTVAGDTLRREVEPALRQIDNAITAAQLFSSSEAPSLRITMSPVFAQRWFLPRLGRWRESHPGINLDIESSMKVLDLQREGFHLAIRTGNGSWPGAASELILETSTPFIAVCAPTVGRRLAKASVADLVHEPLLGDAALWSRWFMASGSAAVALPVATFNDVSLMLQAAEQGLGIAVVRELTAADALADGRLMQLFAVSFVTDDATPYYLVIPNNLKEWPPLIALCDWIKAEFQRPLFSAK